MTILGISCYYHDASACLIQNGRVVAGIAEERLSRIKHDNTFPKRSIFWCLDWANVAASDVDLVVFYEKPLLKFERMFAQHIDAFPKSLGVFRENIGSWFSYKLKIRETLKKELGYSGRVSYVPHHMAHASSAYFTSGFDAATIVTVDGVGEWATTTLGSAKGNTMHIDREIRFPHSLGLLYGAITAYLGFEVNDAEYKVMGYAAYGNPRRFAPQFAELITLFPDGSFALNMKYFDFIWSDRMYNNKLEQLFGLPTRPKESGVKSQYADVAAGLQQTLENAALHLIVAAHKRHKNDNLCLSGGVALNSVMNGKLLTNTPFKRVYIPPDPGDGGGAMGAALYAYSKTDRARRISNFFPNIGPSYPEEQIQGALDLYSLRYTTAKTDGELIRVVSSYLANQKVIGWFQGRMEWGPRALGYRSILASPEKVSMKDVINAKIKHRELFRPFAPAILDAHVSAYFRADTPIPESAKYMLFVYPFTKKGIQKAPATAHVDGTGRLQVVKRSDNRLYYDLIDAFGKRTGIPVVLNTSFNVRGEPIVCSPRDAIECFMKTGIDYLVMGNYIVRKHHG